MIKLQWVNCLSVFIAFLSLFSNPLSLLSLSLHHSFSLPLFASLGLSFLPLYPLLLLFSFPPPSLIPSTLFPILLPPSSLPLPTSPSPSFSPSSPFYSLSLLSLPQSPSLISLALSLLSLPPLSHLHLSLLSQQTGY